MSKFIELYDVFNNKILINIDRILDVYCNSSGQAIITLAAREQNNDYYYTFPNYDYITKRIMEESK